MIRARSSWVRCCLRCLHSTVPVWLAWVTHHKGAARTTVNLHGWFPPRNSILSISLFKFICSTKCCWMSVCLVFILIPVLFSLLSSWFWDLGSDHSHSGPENVVYRDAVLVRSDRLFTALLQGLNAAGCSSCKLINTWYTQCQCWICWIWPKPDFIWSPPHVTSS